MTQSSFAYDSLVKHYSDRQTAYGRRENVDKHTDAINHTLSTEDLIDPNLHDPLKKKKVMQAVMASVIIHKEDHNLSGRFPKHLINPVFENHFKILSLTEKISFGIVDGECDPADFRLLKEYSGIEEVTFFDWFSETCIEHNTMDLIRKIKEDEVRKKSLKDELSQLTEILEKINVLRGEIDEHTLFTQPHHYDGNIKGWANELWAAFTALNPSNTPSAEDVERKIIAQAKEIELDGLIADRYSHLRGAGFGDAQNHLQQIVGWGIETPDGGIYVPSTGDYSLFVWSLIQKEGSGNSAMYNSFVVPAISTVQKLYLKRIKQIKREMQR